MGKLWLYLLHFLLLFPFIYSKFKSPYFSLHSHQIPFHLFPSKYSPWNADILLWYPYLKFSSIPLPFLCPFNNSPSYLLRIWSSLLKSPIISIPFPVHLFPFKYTPLNSNLPYKSYSLHLPVFSSFNISPSNFKLLS